MDIERICYTCQLISIAPSWLGFMSPPPPSTLPHPSLSKKPILYFPFLNQRNKKHLAGNEYSDTVACDRQGREETASPLHKLLPFSSSSSSSWSAVRLLRLRVKRRHALFPCPAIKSYCRRNTYLGSGGSPPWAWPQVTIAISKGQVQGLFQGHGRTPPATHTVGDSPIHTPTPVRFPDVKWVCSG